MEAKQIFTIGHSTLELNDFLKVLHDYGIDKIADIRTVPRSRTNPQFNQDSFPMALVEASIAYLHIPLLGGLRSRSKDFPVGATPNNGWQNESFRNYADYALTDQFQAGLKELLAFADKPTAIMCAEAVWWRCHRRIVADYLLIQNISVFDIVPPSPKKTHILTSFAQVQPDNKIYYPANFTG